jgi:hypothetical protein
MAEKLTTFDPLMTILSHIRQNLASKKTFERKRHLSSHVQEIKKKNFGFNPGLPDGTKIPIWVYFGGPLNEKCLYILWPFCIFCSLLMYFSRYGMM